MTDLTPNGPASRFEYVIKTYWGKKYKGESLNAPVLDTFFVTTSLVGAHDLSEKPDTIVVHDSGSTHARYLHDEMSIERIQGRLEKEENQATAKKGAQAMLKRLGQPYEYSPVASVGAAVDYDSRKLSEGLLLWDSEQWGLADLVLAVVRLPHASPRDFLIPWIARELVKLAKHVIDWTGKPTVSALQRDYSNAVDTLYDKAPAIAQWAKETRTDIGEVDLATALEAIKNYEFKKSLVEQGPVVYTFRDGWTVQELETERSLSQESKNMQNCVEDYCDAVEKGNVRIYSLRDAGGSPHVTMELRPPLPAYLKAHDTAGAYLESEEFIESEERMRWHFAQVLGKQNDMPIGAYRARAREFIDRVFAKEGFGWCITGGTAKWARFAGRHLGGINVPDVLAPNHVDDDILDGADFTGANLIGSSFENISLKNTFFDKANLTEANFRNTTMSDARLEGAICHFTNFAGANLAGASFDSAQLQGADIMGADVRETSFRSARVDGAVLGPLFHGNEADWTSVEMTDVQRERVGMSNAKLVRNVDRSGNRS